MSPEQLAYVEYHSAEQRALRLNAARRANDLAVSEAHRLFLDGDVAAAAAKLFDSGLQDEGISYYLDSWSDDTRFTPGAEDWRGR